MDLEVPGDSEEERFRRQAGGISVILNVLTPPPIKRLRHLPSTVILLCAGHFKWTITLRSTIQSWFHYLHFTHEGSGKLTIF